MLAYFLAIAFAFVGVTLYLTAFLRPQIHRQDDFLWSGLALFYALILWLCAGRITGAVLLGQLAVVTIAIAFIWENRQLRQTIVNNSQNSNQALEGFSILSLILTSLTKLPELTKTKKVKPTKQTSSSETSAPATPTEEEKIEADNSPVLEKPATELEKVNLDENENSAIKSTAEEEKTEVKETLENINEIKETLENIEEVLEDEIELNQQTTTPENTNKQTETQEDILSIPVDVSEDNNLLVDENKGNKDKSAQLHKKGNLFTKLWGKITDLFPDKQKDNYNNDSLELPSTVTESLVADLPDSETFDEDVTASEVESAIANFELDENNNSEEKEEEKTNKLVETEEYTDILEEENLTEDEAILLDEDLQESKIESSVTDDEDLIIDVDDIENDKNRDVEDNPPTDSNLDNNDLDLVGENQTVETEEDDSDSDLDLEIEFDSPEVPAEDTIDSLTDLHNPSEYNEKIDENIIDNDLEDLLDESKKLSTD